MVKYYLVIKPSKESFDVLLGKEEDIIAETTIERTCEYIFIVDITNFLDRNGIEVDNDETEYLVKDAFFIPKLKRL
nr:MAG TPA: hypothetical protein [Caudoviricetes sp.]